MSRHGFLAFVLDQLADVGVTARAMFGGHGLYAGGAFFGIVYDGRLYFHTGPGNVQEYDARGMPAFRPTPRQTLTRYREVPVDVLEDARPLVEWARAAVASRGEP